MCSRLSACCRGSNSENDLRNNRNKNNADYLMGNGGNHQEREEPFSQATAHAEVDASNLNHRNEEEEEPIYAVVKRKPCLPNEEEEVAPAGTDRNEANVRCRNNANNPVPSSTFLVSFLIDSRGGVMKGCRGSGIRVIVPSGAVEQPTRITCRFLRPKVVDSVLPLLETDQVASGLVEFSWRGAGTSSATFRQTVLVEVPHFLQDTANKELVVIKSDNGLTWREHKDIYVGKGKQNQLAVFKEAVRKETPSPVQPLFYVRTSGRM